MINRQVYGKAESVQLAVRDAAHLVGVGSLLNLFSDEYLDKLAAAADDSGSEGSTISSDYGKAQYAIVTMHDRDEQPEFSFSEPIWSAQAKDIYELQKL